MRMASQNMCNDIHVESNGEVVYEDDKETMKKPSLSFEDAVNLTKRLYGYQNITCLKQLVSYDNQNFLIEAHNPRGAAKLDDERKKERFVLKLINSEDSKMVAFHEGQNDVLLMLNRNGILCPRPQPNLQGDIMTLEKISVLDKGNKRRESGPFLTRIMEYVPGQPIGSVTSITMKMCYEAGQLLGKLSHSMQEFRGDLSVFKERGAQYDWNLTNLPRIREVLDAVTDTSQRNLIEEVVDTFEKKVLSVEGRLRKGLIHSDFNDFNILVRKTVSSPEINGHVSIKTTDNEKDVTGILDFDDMVYSCIVYDLGIGMMYIMQCSNLTRDPLQSAGAFLAGFLRENHLDDLEWDALYYCIAARLAQSLTLGLHNYSLHPQNDYLLQTQVKGWEVLRCLWSRERLDLYNQWKKIEREFNE